MVHDIFISYAKEDKTVADTICSHLENDGLRCWIAPRNIAPGEKYATAIIQAIATSKIVIVVFSHNSDQSANVRTEIERAFNQGKTIIPFRIENIEPSDEIQYFIGSRQWLDAFSGSFENYSRQLAQIIKNHLMTDSIPQGSQVNPSPRDNHYDNSTVKPEKEYVKIGSRMNRFIAYIIDLGLAVLCGIFSAIAVMALLQTVWGGIDNYNKIMFLEDGVTSSALGFFVTFGGLLIGMLLFLVFFDLSSYGSPGKRLLSLKIFKIPASSQFRTWRITRSLLKNIPLIVMLVGFCIQNSSLVMIGLILQIVWFIALLVTPKSQSVHDLAAGTIVISGKQSLTSDTRRSKN